MPYKIDKSIFNLYLIFSINLQFTNLEYFYFILDNYTNSLNQ